MILLVIGGSASGKSEYAESRILAYENRIYLATMLPFGREGERTILRHQLLRAGKGFTTVECGRNLQQLTIEPEQSILLEDLPNLVANEIFDATAPADYDSEVWLDTDEFARALPEDGMTTGGADGGPLQDASAAWREIEKKLRAEVEHLFTAGNLVVVTGDVFADGNEYDEETEIYRRLLGRMNQWIGRHADEIVEVIHGIPVRRK